MSENRISRRQFIQKSLVLAGAAAVVPLVQPVRIQAAPRTASDLVPLGKKGYPISRLGMGTGSNGGQVQRDLGQEGFNRLVRHAYDRGVRYIDTADAYGTHEMVREAVKGLPREKLWIQTKMRWEGPDFPEKPLEVVDRFRKELGTDYIDSLLIHCATKDTWPDDLKRMMDAFDEAQSRKWIRMKGVSCHGLPALQRATHADWIEVQLARVNPQGRHVDGKSGAWAEPGIVPAAMKEIQAMHGKGRGIIGMKLIGNGDFKDPSDRDRALRYAMTCGFVDAVVIGFGTTAEIDEAIERMNRALVAAA
jgi:predicted aldo/keto reductase-like oxidoreductase